MKIQLITDENPVFLTDRVNKFFLSHNVKASPIIFANNSFHCFIYYEEEIPNESPKLKSNSITDGQRKFLLKRKIDIEGMTKQEAIQVIGEIKAKEEKRGYYKRGNDEY